MIHGERPDGEDEETQCQMEVVCRIRPHAKRAGRAYGRHNQEVCWTVGRGKTHYLAEEILESRRRIPSPPDDQQRSPFELLYGVGSRLTPIELGPVNEQAGAGREVEVMELEGFWASQAERLNERKGSGTQLTPNFQVGDLVFVSYGKAVNLYVKWQAFRSRFYGLRLMMRSRNQIYRLESEGDRCTRTYIHARRLSLYHPRPDYLQ